MTSNHSRRVFLSTVAVAGCATICGTALAADMPMLSESDPQAKALGYVSDASKADKAKFPQYKEGEHCGNCALYQGKEADAAGPCPLFAGKQVANKGWCSAWAKKG